jgi:hypothetical protein
MRIDFTEVRSILANVERLLAAHQGASLPDPGALQPIARRSDSAIAAMGDDLLAIQDYLQLAAAEVSAVYWLSKGRSDPRGTSSVRGTHPRDTNGRCSTAPSYVPQRRQPHMPQQQAPMISLVERAAQERTPGGARLR